MALRLEHQNWGGCFYNVPRMVMRDRRCLTRTIELIGSYEPHPEVLLHMHDHTNPVDGGPPRQETSESGYTLPSESLRFV